MSSRRGFVLVLTGCVAAGAVVLVAAGRVWRHADLVAATGARVSINVTGHTAEPALPALAIALIVMAGALLAARSWIRRVVGLITVVIGGAVIALAVASRTDATNELRHRAFAVSRTAGGHTLSGWAIVTIVCGLVAVVAGTLTVALSARWPALGSRYEAPAVRRTDHLAGDWDALDRGEDPTL